MENLKYFYKEQGFVIAKSVFADDAVRSLKSHCKGLGEDRHSGVKVFTTQNLSDPLKAFCCNLKLVEMVKLIFGEPTIEFLSVKTVFKDAETTYASPWHQDYPYWGGATHKLSCWIALDRAKVANGCLQIIPKSHTQNYHHTKSDPDKFENRVPEELLVGMNRMNVELEPGDVLFFHDRLLHASHPNTIGLDRWCMISTYRISSVVDNSHIDATTWKQPIKLWMVCL